MRRDARREHWACETAKIIKARSGRPLKRRYQPPVAIEADQFLFAEP
jgi:hypothetical protein